MINLRLFGALRRRARGVSALSRAAQAALAVSLLWLGGQAAAAGEDGLPVLSQPSGAVSAEGARIEARGASALRLRVSLNRPVDSHAFTLAAPNRLVVDMPELIWRFDPSDVAASAPAAVRALGLRNVRGGLFRPGRSRLVIDLDRAVLVEQARLRAAEGGVELLVDMRLAVAPTQASAAELETGSVPAEPTAKRAQPAAASLRIAALGAPSRAPAPRRRPQRRVVVLDPGHGGGDPGAVHGGLLEKDVVLRFAHEVRRRLSRDPRVLVVMTREDDRFLDLADRVKVAREARADLFLSIHADALPAHPNIHGASFYTLAEDASDTLARTLARRQNAQKEAALPVGGRSRWVNGLVTDFAQRSAAQGSHALVESMIRSFRASRAPLLKKPHREDNFAVLRHFNQAAALVEIGFLTSLIDRRRFENSAWRETAAQALADGVSAWLDAQDAPEAAGETFARRPLREDEVVLSRMASWRR